MKRIAQTIFIFLLMGSHKIQAQDLALVDVATATDAFRNTVLINAQTTTMVEPHSFMFTIRHRFGAFEFDNNAVKNFFGFDLVANIRFGFVVPLTSNLYVGAGRTKNGKTYDGEVKHLIIKQDEDNKIPVSVALYANAAITTDDFLPVPKYAYFSDGTTEFKYKFNHRLSYNSQIIFSRKFCENFSFQVTPTLIYRNLVNVGVDNRTIALPVSAAFKTGMNSSILVEYAYRFTNKPEDKHYPLSLAMEFGTVGHVFQIVVSSTQEILEQQVYTGMVSDYTKGKFLLGFNIKRSFWKKDKKTNP